MLSIKKTVIKNRLMIFYSASQNIRIIMLIIVLFGSFIMDSLAQNKDVIKHPNIFLIYADDLRPELGAYGVEEVKSPNIDRLANDALVFNSIFGFNSPTLASKQKKEFIFDTSYPWGEVVHSKEIF